MKNLIKFFIFFISPLLFFTACSKYDYTLHKPVVRYAKPSKGALSVMLRESYGKRYRWAEEGPRSFDCSGLTYYTYGSMNLWLPRRAIEQSRYGKRVSINNLRYGDLIFFDTRKRPIGKVNHVGIYIGNNYFIHASSSKKRVIKTSLKKPYYRHRVVVCKRVIPSKYYNQCIAKKKKRLKKLHKHKYKYKSKYGQANKIKSKSIKELFDNIDINNSAKIIEDENNQINNLLAKPIATDKSIDKNQNTF